MNKLEQAAREVVRQHSMECLSDKAVGFLREALAEQAEQEPVAWRVRGYNQFKTGNSSSWRYVDGMSKPSVNKPDCCDFEPLYTAPQPVKLAISEEVFNWIDANAPLFVRDAVQPVKEQK